MKKILLGSTAVAVALFAVSSANAHQYKNNANKPHKEPHAYSHKKHAHPHKAKKVAPVVAKAAPMAPKAAAPGTPELLISGETTGYMSFFHNKDISIDGFVNKGGQGYAGRVEDSRLNFDVTGRTSALGGLDYSFLIAISGDKQPNKKSIIKENRLKVKGSWGTIVFGNTKGPDNFMAVGGFSVIGGFGGFDGRAAEAFINNDGAPITTDLVGTPGDSTKLIYVTPMFGSVKDTGGVQFGLGFTPSTSHFGEQKYDNSNSDSDGNRDERNFSAGIKYKKAFGKLVMTGSLTGVTAKPKYVEYTLNDNSFKDTQAYAAGVKFDYGDFNFGAEYLDNRKSRVEKVRAALGANAGKSWNVAAGYNFGPLLLSAGYFHSEYRGTTDDITISEVDGESVQTTTITLNSDKSKSDVYSAAADYKLAPGLTAYGEVNYYHTKTGAVKNRGHVISTGAKIKF